MHFHFINTGKTATPEDNVREHGIDRCILNPLLDRPTPEELDLARLAF